MTPTTAHPSCALQRSMLRSELPPPFAALGLAVCGPGSLCANADVLSPSSRRYMIVCCSYGQRWSRGLDVTLCRAHARVVVAPSQSVSHFSASRWIESINSVLAHSYPLRRFRWYHWLSYWLGCFLMRVTLHQYIPHPESCYVDRDIAVAPRLLCL